MRLTQDSVILRFRRACILRQHVRQRDTAQPDAGSREEISSRIDRGEEVHCNAIRCRRSQNQGIRIATWLAAVSRRVQIGDLSTTNVHEPTPGEKNPFTATLEFQFFRCDALLQRTDDGNGWFVNCLSQDTGSGKLSGVVSYPQAPAKPMFSLFSVRFTSLLFSFTVSTTYAEPIQFSRSVFI